MKTILFLLLMTAPDGNQWEMDSGLSLDDCRAVATAGAWSGYYDGARVLPLPDGAAFTCEPMTAQEASE